MLQRNCFPVSIPHGIIYKGDIYTVESLIDQKAGTSNGNILLKDLDSDLEIKLAPSSSTLELQRFNLSSRYSAIKDYTQQIIATLQKDFSMPAEQINELTKEIYVIQRIFYEDTKKRKISTYSKRKFKKIRDKLIVPSSDVIDPNTYITHPFDHSVNLLQEVAVKGELLERDSEVSWNFDFNNFHEKLMKGPLSILKERAQDYFLASRDS